MEPLQGKNLQRFLLIKPAQILNLEEQSDKIKLMGKLKDCLEVQITLKT